MTPPQIQSQVGLCERCEHSSRVTSARGSTFYLCKQAAVDPHYPRYPRLPVLQCEAYKPSSSEPTAGEESQLP